MRHTRNSSSRDRRRSLCLVFIAVKLEKPSSHKYVVEKGSNVETALFATIGYSLAAVSQKLAIGTSDVSFVNDSFILNESLQGLESNESSQKKICSFSRGHASGLA